MARPLRPHVWTAPLDWLVHASSTLPAACWPPPLLAGVQAGTEKPRAPSVDLRASVEDMRPMFAALLASRTRPRAHTGQQSTRAAPMLKPALSLLTEMYAGALHLPLARDSTKPWPRSEVTPAAAYALCRNTYAMPPLTPAAPACSWTFLQQQ